MTTIEKKIQKKVDEINNLISLASNSESENAYDGKFNGYRHFKYLGRTSSLQTNYF